MSYIGSLEQIGEVDEKLEYVEEAKTLINENVTIRHMIEEIDLLTFLFNVDFSRWNRQESEEYESFLTPENYQKLMEMWEKARSLYNLDDLFKNKRINEIENDTRNANITILNEKWYSKVILSLKIFLREKDL